jgi:ketosteroid isomerase-like protein
MYGAFNRGDIEEVLTWWTDDITWYEPEGDPAAGTHHGPDEIVKNVFGTIPDSLDRFEAVPDRFIESGDTVVVEGNFMVTTEAGKDYEIPFAQVCELRDGKLQQFTNYTDTVVFQQAIES